MPKKGYKKETPRIVAKDVYRFISNNSSLSKEQVKECFDTYGKMMEELLDSDDRPNDLTIVVPKIGVFRFFKVKAKKGSTYVVPTCKKNEYRRITADRPSYVQLKFEVAKKLRDRLREKTENYEE